jgi:hypothetical protein
MTHTFRSQATKNPETSEMKMRKKRLPSGGRVVGLMFVTNQTSGLIHAEPFEPLSVATLGMFKRDHTRTCTHTSHLMTMTMTADRTLSSPVAQQLFFVFPFAVHCPKIYRVVV